MPYLLERIRILAVVESTLIFSNALQKGLDLVVAPSNGSLGCLA